MYQICKMRIENIYVLIHQDFDRLGTGSGDLQDHWLLSPESHDIYTAVKHQQELLVEKIITHPRTAFVVYPYVLRIMENYPNFGLEKRTLIDTQIDNLGFWAWIMQRRFILLDDNDFEDKEVEIRESFLGKKTRKNRTEIRDLDLQKKLGFEIARTANVFAFGEAIRGCVTHYGKAICRGLGVSEKRFKIIEHASLHSLLHESEHYFHQSLATTREFKLK